MLLTHPATLTVVVLTVVSLAVEPIATLTRLTGNTQRAEAQSASFLYTFDGSPSSPQPWRPVEWDIQVHSRDDRTWVGLEPIAAHHGTDCSPPPATHINTSYESAVFLCKDHVMTAMSAGGYGVVYLTPNQLVDFSGGEAVVRWDMSTFIASNRDWVDLWITPYEDNLALPLEQGLPDLQGPPRRAMQLKLIGGGFNGTIYNNFAETQLPRHGTEYTSVLTPDAARRDTFEVRLTRTHVKFWMPQYNFVFVDASFADLGWDSGVVQLGHHSYNPDKACDGDGSCRANTWHWDNVSIAPVRPFSIIRADRRSVDPSNNPQVTFPRSAPESAHLRFAAHGETIDVSVDDGRTWQRAQLAGQIENSTGAFRSYWQPVPAGTTRVSFRGTAASHAPSWIARDISIWAPSGSPGGQAAAPAVQATATSPPQANPTRTAPPTATNTPEPTATHTAQPTTAQPPGNGSTSPAATSPSVGSRIPWRGRSWYLQGANVPWYGWGCDFGCGPNGGGASSASVQSIMDSAFAQLRATGAHTVRWWVFPGDPWQITRDSAGAPTGLNPAVYADFDAALRLAEAHDLYLDFVLFSSPTAMPSAWSTDPAQRSRLVSALSPLFARYRGNPHLLSWEVFNEPEWDIWGGRISQAPVQATVRAIADAVHANSTAYVTVGSANLDGLSMWVGQGLDYYQAHWYDYMNRGGFCARCTDYPSVRARFNLDAPLVIGELYAGADADALERFEDFYDKGYAGAWAWSLLPDRTRDHMAIDLDAVEAFAGEHDDLGPQAGLAIPPTSPPAAPVAATSTPVRTATPVPTSTPGPSAKPTAIPAPSPAAVPVSGGLSTVVTFNDIAVQRPLRVEYPAGTINWQSNAWMVSGPWKEFKTNSLSFNGSAISSGNLNFRTPRRLVSLQAYNGGPTTATVTFSCAGQRTKEVKLSAGRVATIELGWTGTCTTVTLATTNKWNTNFDNLVIG